MTISDLTIGQKAEQTRIVTDAMIDAFASVSEDHNPVHLDEGYAKNTIFKKRIAHGLLISSFISAALGNALPGPGSIYLEQNLKFVRPVFIGDTITTLVEILRIHFDRSIVELRTACANQNDQTVIEGTARIKLMS